MSVWSAQALLIDIEGTTSEIAFVHEVLFPYARHEVAGFLEKNAEKPEILAILEQIARDDGADNAWAWNPFPWPSGTAQQWVVEKIHRWIDADAKFTGLKTLQGHLWERGYRDGTLLSHVYADVPEKFQSWHASGILLYIYSSGSVAAQQLLFAHTEKGNLTPFLSGYFDTAVGSKRESGSYLAIAQAIDRAPGDILYLSDVPAELDAARLAGFQTTLVVRPGNPPLEATEHPQITTFAEIDLAKVTLPPKN